MDRYIKFVKERTDIEQNYAKQLRNLTKKYNKRGNKDDQDCKYSNHAAFQEILKELNDYAGQREVIAESMTTTICTELIKHLQDFKVERKNHLLDVKKAQQNLDSAFKHLETIKKRSAKEWAEAEKATQQAEKIESDTNSTKPDVDKAKQHANVRTHIAEECRTDYAAELQKYNKEQKSHYYSEIPQILNKLQDMDERRIRILAEKYCRFSEIEKNVLSIITKCLDGITAAGKQIDEKKDSKLLIEQHKSGFERPGDVEFEDYTQGVKKAISESSLNPPKVRGKLRLFGKKHKVNFHDVHTNASHSLTHLCFYLFNLENTKQRQILNTKDFSHLPPEQRKKKLQAKIEEISKDLQKTQDQSEALDKMKGVYEQTPQMGDPASLEPQILETSQKINRLKGELNKYETWLSDAVGGEESPSTINNNSQHGNDNSQNIYTSFEEDFDDIPSPIGHCEALYTFQGNSEGTVSILEGELLTIMENDKGDGWMRVLKGNGEEGYIPSSYVKQTA
uniref:Thyroid hormone receptor interactor 10b n=1 Tax=Oryzias sinensis TaxID=183150 RepID=A0A8C8DUP3_9TELE